MSIAHLRKITDEYFKYAESNGITPDLNDNAASDQCCLGLSTWKTITDTLDDLIFIFDQHGNVVESNVAGKNLIDKVPDVSSQVRVKNTNLTIINDKPYRLSSVNIDKSTTAVIARAVVNVI